MIPKPSNPSQPEGTDAVSDGMVRIEGGAFLMGDDRFYPEEAPVTEVIVPPFLIDATPVTNAQFAAFVDETRHVTTAERAPDPAQYPDADPAMLVPGSLVFIPPQWPVDLRLPDWWVYTPGADWRHPEGPDSDIDARADHPVVHVSYDDAMAFAAWAGKSLPNEAEWEYAAKGGAASIFSWGDDTTRDGRRMANTWEGLFPRRNDKPTGPSTEPVASYPANGFGLYDMLGNVWEWTSDAYWDHRTPSAAENTKDDCCTAAVTKPAKMARRTIKGGSFLCAENHCFRFRPAARQPQTEDTSTCNIGLRCIMRT